MRLAEESSDVPRDPTPAHDEDCEDSLALSKVKKRKRNQNAWKYKKNIHYRMSSFNCFLRTVHPAHNAHHSFLCCSSNSFDCSGLQQEMRWFLILPTQNHRLFLRLILQNMGNNTTLSIPRAMVELWSKWRMGYRLPTTQGLRLSVAGLLSSISGKNGAFVT